MKRIVLLSLVFCTTIGYAQIPETYPGIKNLTERNNLNYRPNNLNKSKTDSFFKQLMKSNHSLTFLNPKAKFSHSLPNGNKLYILLQDNLPCIVPDMSQFNMPNAGRKIKARGMPPGKSPPQQIIPE